MSPLHRILSLGIALLAFVLLHAWAPPPAAAQDKCIPDGVSCGDSIPPTMTISPTGTVTTSPVTITIEWCDDGALEPGSRIIEIDGVDRTAEFSFSRVTAPGCDDAAKSQASIALSPGTHAVYAYICDGSYSGPNCADSTASLTFDDKLPAQLSTAPHNGDYRNAALCVAGCFDATARYTTPAYVSLDRPWALTLFYSSAQAQPRGVVQIDATDNSATPPEKMSLALRRADGTWVTLTHGATEVFYRSGPGKSRLAAQFDASTLATGAYDYTAVVRSWWGSTFEEATVPVRVLILNERTSPFGAGWSLLGLQRIYAQPDGSVVIAEGDGSLAYFKRTSCPTPWTCTYASPAGDFSTLTGGNGEYYTRRYPDGTTFTFLPDGRLRWVEDRFNNTTTYNWLNATQLGSIQDATGVAGHGFYVYHDAAGKLREIRAFSRSSHFTVDAAGNLIRIQDPDGLYALQATYDANHRLEHRTDRRGGAWGFAYDFAGKLAADTMPQITADGQSVRPVVRLRSAESATLADPALGYGSFSNPAPRVLPDSVRAEVTNPRGFTTRFALNRFGAPTRIEEPLGRTTQFSYTAHSQVSRVVSPSGHTVDYTWSGPNLTQIRDVNTGRTINYAYGTPYNQVTQASGDIVPVWNYYSADGRTLDSTRVGTLSSKVTKYTYDSRGRLLTVTDPEGHVTRYFYASSSMMNTDSIKDGPRRTAFTYDTYGRTATVKDALNYVTTTHYDLLNRVTRTIGPAADTTTFEYDALYLIRVRDAEGQLYQFSPNALGWVEVETDPALRQQHHAYDRNGNLKGWTNRRGQTVTYTYDELDRLLTRTADGKTTTYGHDPRGLFTAVSNAESTDTLKFDVAGRPKEEITVRAGLRYVLTSGHDKRDLRTSVSLTTGGWHSITYRYDTFMQLDRLTVAGVGSTNIGYNDDRQANSFTLPRSDGTIGLTITRQYPSTHIAGAINYSLYNINAAVGVNYTHDALRRVAKRHSVSGDSLRAFDYDALGRLTGVADYLEFTPDCVWDYDEAIYCPPANLELVGEKTYAYDKVGNRTDSGAALAPGNRLTAFAGYSFEYDNDGNLTRKYKTGFDQRLYRNSLGQLDSVWTSGVGTVRFGYDGWGRRVRKSTDTQTTRYVWDGDDLFLELDGAGTIQPKYASYPGTDRPHSVQRGGAVYYFATDFPGNVLGLIDRANFALVNEYRYEPFGKAELSLGTVTNPLRYAGRELDPETGLYYLRARYYDPEVGRFVSEDPIGLAGGINLYAYAGNDPGTARDPSGLQEENPKPGQCQKRDGLEGTDQVCGVAGITVEVEKGPWVVGPPIWWPTPGGGVWISAGGGGRPAGQTRRVAARSGPAISPQAQCVAGVALSDAGGVASFIEHENIRGNEWRGLNGKWYRLGWGGNQYTGGRNVIVARGLRARYAARALGAAGMVISAVQVFNAAANQDFGAAGLYFLDFVMGGVGTFGGPWGVTASMVYFTARYVLDTYTGPC